MRTESAALRRAKYLLEFERFRHFANIDAQNTEYRKALLRIAEASQGTDDVATLARIARRALLPTELVKRLED